MFFLISTVNKVTGNLVLPAAEIYTFSSIAKISAIPNFAGFFTLADILGISKPQNMQNTRADLFYRPGRFRG